MTSQPDFKLTIEEVEKWAEYWQHPGWENEHQVAKQLADTMRENERLREETKRWEERETKICKDYLKRTKVMVTGELKKPYV